MRPPDRLTVPTCIGCGAMSQFGTCDSSCSEHKLELVTAGAYDALLAAVSGSEARADAFAEVAAQIAHHEPGASEIEDAYTSAQRRARDVLRRHPDVDQDAIDLEQAAHATTWWCAECGGLDAPQPCLGICVWRPVEWVKRSLYEQTRERAMSARDREQRLRHLLRRVAWITPREGQWETGWRMIQNEARDARAAAPA